MIQAAGDMGASMICDLAVAIIRDGKVPSDWEQSFIVCLYKGKGDTLERGNYCGLKLTEQVMKILERIVDGLIRQLVSIDDSQFGFVPGRSTADAIFVVRQLQKKYLAANKRLYMAFVHLEKAFDRVLGRSSGGRWENLVWRSGLCGWCRSRVRVGEGYSEVWSESWCSPKISTQPAALHHCAWSLITRVPLWGPLGGPLCRWPCYTVLAESLEECVRRLLTWKEAIEKKGLRVNAGKIKIMICGTGLDLLQSSGKFPCASVALEWAATASSAMAASTRCTRNAVGSSTWKRTQTTDVHGARELHTPWMADHRRKSRSDLTSLKW